MPLNDILLHLDSYPDPTPVEAVDWAIGFAGLLQAKLTALAVKARFPVHSNRMANYLIGLSGMVSTRSRGSTRRRWHRSRPESGGSGRGSMDHRRRNARLNARARQRRRNRFDRRSRQ